MKMNVGENPYRNSHVAYVKELFKDVPKNVKGKLVAIGNGGYTVGALSPDFGYRVYFNSNLGMFHVQVISETRGEKFGERLKEYGVFQKDNTSLTSVINAILYYEYRVRV